MNHFERTIRNALRDNPKAGEDLMEMYVMRPGYMPDQGMSLADVAYREGQKAMALYFIDLATRTNDDE